MLITILAVLLLIIKSNTGKVKGKNEYLKYFNVSLTLPILLFFSAEIFAYDTYNSGT